MADNLESYFKKNLSEDKAGAEDWNVPSDKVWENVLPEIQKKRGLFIPWRYLYILGILMIAGLVSIIWYANSSDPKLIEGGQGSNVNTEIIHSTPDDFENESQYQTDANDGKSLSDQKLNANDQTTVTEKQQDGKTTDKIESSSEISNAVIASNSNARNAQTAHQNNQAEDNIPDGYKSGRAVYSENENTAISNVIILNNDWQSAQLQTLPKSTIDDISAPLLLTIDERDNSNPVPANEYLSRRKEPINNKGRFGIGAYIVPTFNATSVDGEPLQGAIETSNMLMYSTNWGFELRYHISNRFTLVTGIGKSEIKSWSKCYTEFGYDTSTEDLMPTGEKQNTSPLPMQTPFGEIDTEITFQFSGSEEFPDGEPMQSAMETHQDIRYLSIPLGVEFNVIRFSRFSWFLEGGLRYNRAIKDATQFTSRVLHSGDDMDVVSEKLMSNPSYTENYLSFYIGTGLNYQLSKSLQLSGSARYFGNITNVNLQDNMSTYVQGFDFKVGIVFLF